MEQLTNLETDPLTDSPGPLIIPPSVLYDDKLNPAEILFAGRLIGLMGKADSLTLTNDQLGLIAGRTSANVSLMLTKLQANGHLQLEYRYGGRGVGQRRTVSLSTPTRRSLIKFFGADWYRLVQPATAQPA